jgi:hypothetical protein
MKAAGLHLRLAANFVGAERLRWPAAADLATIVLVGVTKVIRSARYLTSCWPAAKVHGMSTMSTIVIPVVVAVISGAGGSAITTYGAQTKDRRDARGEARKSFTKAEDVVAQTEALALPRDELAGLESSAFTAGIPSYLIQTYKDARDLATKMRKELKAAEAAVLGDVKNEDAAKKLEEAKARSSSADLAANLVSALLLHSLWHPWLAWFTRYQQCHRLRLVLADLDRVSANRELETRRDRKVFVKEHVKNYHTVEREKRRKEKEAKVSLSSVRLDLSEPSRVLADEGASE